MQSFQVIMTVMMSVCIAVMVPLLVVARKSREAPPSLYRGMAFQTGFLATIAVMPWVSVPWMKIVVGVLMVATLIGMATNLWSFVREQARTGG
jgi:hypothetical protein